MPGEAKTNCASKTFSTDDAAATSACEVICIPTAIYIISILYYSIFSNILSIYVYIYKFESV